MFWSLRENIGGLKHLSRLTARVVLRQDTSKYIQSLNKSFPDLDLKPAFDDHGKPLTCRFCGFAIFSVNLGTYQFAACSAVADNVILHKHRLVEWTETLPTFESMKLESSQKKLLK
ncbi:MAG: hypothetical protein QG574_2113 [Cyanobacteriota bacterium erpe_2018_sw_21hr_WHONDRS-SW48-000092_B_bin.40]|jgi:hypothetical protein|nr:hypothetical protein [Cyanobacteriota bacterium erpe_2018_sw_21hr_WHONDRS-SW48-000092_B_bin.40]